MPIVSVIIPNYNHARYLKQRIDSVLNQTYQDFELIILDDKSTDNSKEVIEQYRNHPKVSHIVYNEQNSGTTFKQWNKGIKLAKGDYIWLAESDDAAENTFLEELVKPFQQNEKLGIVYCDSYYMDENGEKGQFTHIWKNKTFSTKRWDNDYENNGVSELNEYFLYHAIIDNVSSAVFRKESMINAGMADESFRYAGDLYFYQKILMIADIAYIKKPLNFFRDHLINTSKQAFVNGLRPLEELLVYAKISLYNDKITEEAKRKRNVQAVENLRYFIHSSLNLNRSIKLFIEGNLKLYKANPRYYFLLYKNLFRYKFYNGNHTT